MAIPNLWLEIWGFAHILQNAVIPSDVVSVQGERLTWEREKLSLVCEMSAAAHSSWIPSQTAGETDNQSWVTVLEDVAPFSGKFVPLFLCGKERVKQYD